MIAINADRRSTGGSAVSRRLALRGLGAVGLTAALGLRVPGQVAATRGHQVVTATSASLRGDDLVALIEAHVAAVNAGDLEAILDLYADEAVHIFLPTSDGSAGVCHGKEQFRMWYEQSLANGDRVAVEASSLAANGNQAAFVTRISSDPWRGLGLKALEAQADLVVIDGQIMTHVVTLTPESVRQLQSAREAVAVPTSISGDAWAVTQASPG